MNLESYFDFLAPDDIRIKGTRVGIESVLYEYIHREKTAEAIAKRFPTLELEQVYATILYYLHNKEKMNEYLEDWLAYGKRMRERQRENPPPIIVRLEARKKELSDGIRASG